MYVNVVDESAYAAVGVSLLSAYVANAALEADLGGIEGWGGAVAWTVPFYVTAALVKK